MKITIFTHPTVSDRFKCFLSLTTLKFHRSAPSIGQSLMLKAAIFNPGAEWPDFN
jgi:hypothetical protein